jgi:hypothetical protein
MLATAADPWSPDSWVLRRRKGHYGQWEVPTTPIHLMYQEFMRGVDVTDQLHAAYPTLMRSHKWWHKCVSFVVDQSLVNAKILHDGLAHRNHKAISPSCCRRPCERLHEAAATSPTSWTRSILLLKRSPFRVKHSAEDVCIVWEEAKLLLCMVQL